MDFATAFIALYVAHHIGDYWVQTEEQATHKGAAGFEGVRACVGHVLSYLLTQALALAAVLLFAPGISVDSWGWWQLPLALLVSGGTHYAADRREHGLLFKLARLIPGKANFLKLGVPRAGRDDNPSLGTGAWALDQSWHILFGCFVPALILAA